MKFHQLPHGARFEYQGTAYQKISPLKARSSDGQREKLIPRSAKIVLLGDHGQAVAPGLPERLDGTTVEQQLSAFLAACGRVATRIEPALNESQLQQLQQGFAQASEQLLAGLATTQVPD